MESRERMAQGGLIQVIVAPFFGTTGDAREHPWRVTTYKPEHKEYSGRYYDFRVTPELIPTVLEDFVPYSTRPAIKRFYDFLKWINGPDSALESNDSAFRRPHSAESDLFDYRQQCDGRVEVIHRDLSINTDPQRFYSMTMSACVFLQLERRDFSAGFFEVSHAKTVFKSAPPGTQNGARLQIRFIAFGHSEYEAFANLAIVIDSVAAACRLLSAAYPM